MKVLTTEQQNELQQLLETLSRLEGAESYGQIAGQVNYWAIELKPKRIRKPKETVFVSPEIGD